MELESIKKKVNYLLFLIAILLISGCAAQKDASQCPSGLQSCGKGCIPAIAICCDDQGINSYC
ncbi:MAG: hypothetical protein KJ601_06860, partial [Nanoarchaeota archaeon]|nr:hypothetical protein [Nanoarchaeota archaeon]